MTRFFIGQVLDAGMFPIIDDVYRIDTKVEQRWFVATVDPRLQNAMMQDDDTKRIALADIEAMAIETYAPRRTYWGPRDRMTGKQPRRVGPAMPGYIFARLPFEGAFERFLSCDGVRRVLTNLGSPQRLRDAWIDRMRDREASGGFDETRGRRGVRNGPFPDWIFPTAIVRIIDGPFASFNAQVIEAVAYGRVKVEVALFGRETSVELDLAQVNQIC